ncbi:MAG: peptidylprolyl isomerase [Rhodocyclaceae bacterium]|nr:peptidylprolyl isomerase [Rhodocyclaceae bacterium]
MKMKTTRLAMALLIMGSQLGSNAVFAADAAPKAAAIDVSTAALVEFLSAGAAPGPETDNRRAALQKELTLQDAIIAEANKLQVVDQRNVQIRMEIARRQAIVAAYWADFVRRNPIAEATMTDAYAKLVAANGNRQYQLSHIVVADEAAAQKVMNELKKPKVSFAAVAKSQSLEKQTGANGGDLGWRWKTEIAPLIADKIVAAKPGDLIGPNKNANGAVSIVKLEASREQQMPEYEKLKPQIEKSFRQQLERQELARLSKPAG